MKLSSAIKKLEKNGWTVRSSNLNPLVGLVTAYQGGSIITCHVQADRLVSFKVSGPDPDRAEFDEFNSFYCDNLTRAIRLASSLYGHTFGE